MIRVKSITKIEDVCRLRKRWDFLLSLMDNQANFFSFEWYATALETLDKDVTPFVIVLIEDEEIMGIVPLVMRKIKRSFNKISFIDNAYTPFQDFIIPIKTEECVDALINYLSQASKRSVTIVLNEVRPDSRTMKLFLKSAMEKGFIIDKSIKNPSHYINTSEDWQKKVEQLPSKQRKEFSRKIKRMQSLGNVELIKVDEWINIEDHLHTFFALYQRTWKGQEPNPDFYFKIAEALNSKGQFLLYYLSVNGKPVAYLYGLYSNGILYGIKTTYDPDFYAFSPGIVLFYKCIELFFFDERIREFDIGRGAEQYKREWTNLVHPQAQIILIYNKFIGSLYLFYKNKIVNKLKTKEGIYSSIRDFYTGYFLKKMSRDIDYDIKIIDQTYYVKRECKECKREFNINLDYINDLCQSDFNFISEAREFRDQLAVSIGVKKLTDVEKTINDPNFSLVLCIDNNSLLGYCIFKDCKNAMLDYSSNYNLEEKKIEIIDWNLNPLIHHNELSLDLLLQNFIFYFKKIGVVVVSIPCKFKLLAKRQFFE